MECGWECGGMISLECSDVSLPGAAEAAHSE